VLILAVATDLEMQIGKRQTEKDLQLDSLELNKRGFYLSFCWTLKEA
jgi:hypothetical protein